MKKEINVEFVLMLLKRIRLLKLWIASIFFMKFVLLSGKKLINIVLIVEEPVKLTKINFLISK